MASEREELERLQCLLADALTGADPQASLQRGVELPAELRDAVSCIDRVGLQIAALLVAKLRFERLMNGSLRANAWWERDAAGFIAAFRRYCSDVPPTGSNPWAEARLFEKWLQR